MDAIKHLLYDYLVSVNFSETSSKYLNMMALGIALFIIVLIIDFITRKILIQIFTNFASKSKTNFDDLLVVVVIRTLAVNRTGTPSGNRCSITWPT